jgi:hypothetical protein
MEYIRSMKYLLLLFLFLSCKSNKLNPEQQRIIETSYPFEDSLYNLSGADKPLYDSFFNSQHKDYYYSLLKQRWVREDALRYQIDSIRNLAK